MTRVIAGKYALGPMLGRGGMGEVYEAQHLPTARRVALKLLRAPTGDADPTRTGGEDTLEAIRRFEQEARAVASINSPHIVQVYDAGRDDTTGERFMAMELLSGEDVGAMLRRVGPVPIPLALKIGAQACVALSHAHAASIVHRDIKPANLYIAAQPGTDRAVVKVVDFGIARVRTVDASSMAEVTHDLTRTGSMLGSPMYMAPEQARGQRFLDHRVDIWSLGVVLYKLLCGYAPFEGAEMPMGELLIAICTAPAPPLQSRAPWIPPEVATAVHRALALDPSQRYFSAEEMGRALVALLPPGPPAFDMAIAEIHGIDARAQARVEPPMPMAPMPTPAGPTNPPAPLDRRTKRTLAACIVAFVLVIIGWNISTFYRFAQMKKQSDEAVAASVASAQQRAAQLNEDSDRQAALIRARRGWLPVPAHSRVEVDGKPAVVRADNKVEIDGDLGSYHAVRILDGKSDTTEQVMIGDDLLLIPHHATYPQDTHIPQ